MKDTIRTDYKDQYRVYKDAEAQSQSAPEEFDVLIDGNVYEIRKDTVHTG